MGRDYQWKAWISFKNIWMEFLSTFIKPIINPLGHFMSRLIIIVHFFHFNWMPGHVEFDSPKWRGASECQWTQSQLNFAAFAHSSPGPSKERRDEKLTKIKYLLLIFKAIIKKFRRIPQVAMFWLLQIIIILLIFVNQF
jgi:hypothetical protein